MKSKIFVLLRVTISIGLVGFLLWSMRGNFSDVKGTLSRTNVLLFSLAAAMYAFNIGVMSLRLKLLFVGENLDIPLGKVVQLSFIGIFFNNFMPTAVGGDIVKAYYSYKQTKEAAKSFIAVFMDRFIGLSSFIFIAVLALFLSWQDVAFSLKKIVIAFAVIGIVFFLIILNGFIAKVILNLLSKLKLWNIGEKISKVYKAVHDYKGKKSTIMKAAGISVVSQSIYFLTVYVLAKSLGINIAIFSVFLIMPVVSIVSMLPSLGGLGLREGAIIALFGPIIANENAFSLSILLLATLLLTSLIGALIYVFASQFKIKQKDISELSAYSV